MIPKPIRKPPLNSIQQKNDCSNPSGSTFKSLNVSELERSLTKKMTKSPMTLDFRDPKIYNAGGDITQQWFVYYSFKHPTRLTQSGKPYYKRFKVFKDINSKSTLPERTVLANSYRKVVLKWLENGNNPFVETANRRTAKQIGSCIDIYLTYIDEGNLSRHTKRKYKLEITIFKNWLEEIKAIYLDISDIKKQHIREFINHLKKERKLKSGKTINHYLNDIRTFFNYFINNYDEYLVRNPASSITPEKVEIRGNVAFNENEFKAVKKEILKSDPYLWLICQIVYYAALRNEAEALNVKIRDIDLKNNRIYVSGRIAKARINQAIPLYPELKKVFEEMNINQHPDDFYLFGRNDAPGLVRVGEDRFAKRFRKIKAELKLGHEYGIYCFKSTRACHLYDDGADLRDIQVLFRHEDLVVTMNYLRTIGRVERGRELNKGREI